MIVDKLKNADLYYGLGEKIATALEFLAKTDLSRLNSGRYDINGDDIFALVQDYSTKSRESALWEAHCNYIDIQYVIEGEELIGYTNIDNLQPKTDYDTQKDIVFLEGDGDFIRISAGTFMILTPYDAHMPSISVKNPTMVKKVVIKVKA